MEIIKKGKENLSRINKKIGEKYEEMENFPEGCAREGEILDKLMELKGELRNFAENVEPAKRTHIENFYLDNMGKNRAYSFAITRESTVRPVRVQRGRSGVKIKSLANFRTILSEW